MKLFPGLFAFGILVLFAGVHSGADDKERLNAKPPKKAVILFDGKDAAAWQHESGKLCQWKIEDGTLVVTPRTGNLVTKAQYGDFKAHVEFNLPSMQEKKGQARANSGVKLHGLYEIQILDSVDNPTYPAGGCGSIYRQKEPDKNVCKAPGEWHSYDITFRAPRYDADDKLIEKPRVTLLWNGVKVHDNVEIKDITNTDTHGNILPKTGPLLLQDHSCPVRFRNIWVVPGKS